jgi:hypothetical protein
MNRFLRFRFGNKNSVNAYFRFSLGSIWGVEGTPFEPPDDAKEAVTEFPQDRNSATAKENSRMRRLMLALSIASFIATPAAFAHHHGGGSSGFHARSHHGHTRNSSNDADNQANTNSPTSAFNASDRSRVVADVGRSRHHDRVPDEEELGQPEQ